MSGGYKYRPVSVKRNLKIEAHAVVSECAVCYCVVADQILRDYCFTSYLGQCVSAPKHCGS